MEKSINTDDKNNKNKDHLTASDSDSNEDNPTATYIKNRQIQKSETVKSIVSSLAISAKLATTTNAATSKPSRKQKETTKPVKRVRSPNSSIDKSTLDNKDLKTSNNDVYYLPRQHRPNRKTQR